MFTPSNGNYSTSTGALNYVVKKVINQPNYAVAPGQGSTLVGFNTTTNQQSFAIMPFGPTFKGGMTTATGDTNGDGTADIIVAAGVGGNSTIKIYDGLTLGVIAVVLGIAFEKQNIAFMVSLAFAIAASANFPVLFMSVLWKNCTTKGAVIGGFLGLVSSVALTVVSPSVWEAVLGNPKGSALFPYSSPALFSITIGFVGVWLFSVLDNSENAKKERAAFAAQQVRSETGLGASGASGH